MKYYKSLTAKVKKGPGNKPLNIVLAKQSISEKEFSKIINDFIDAAEDAPADRKEETRDMIWKNLHEGKSVTLDNGDDKENVTLTLKK